MLVRKFCANRQGDSNHRLLHYLFGSKGQSGQSVNKVWTFDGEKDTKLH